MPYEKFKVLGYSQCEDVRTGLWNEYIVTPINILNVEETN